MTVNGLSSLATSKSLGDLTNTNIEPLSTPVLASKACSTTVTTVIQCHVPAGGSPSSLSTRGKAASVDLAHRSGSDFGRFRNSLKVLAGGVCRGLGQGRQMRRVGGRSKDRGGSSDSSSDDIKVVNSEPLGEEDEKMGAGTSQVNSGLNKHEDERNNKEINVTNERTTYGLTNGDKETKLNSDDAIEKHNKTNSSNADGEPKDLLQMSDSDYNKDDTEASDTIKTETNAGNSSSNNNKKDS